MFKTYFKTAWRNIARNKVYSIINILGLALGVSACLIIFLITDYQLSFDTFHPDKARIYRLVANGQDMDGKTFKTGFVPNPTADMFRNTVTGFETVAGFFVYNVAVKVPNGNESKAFPMAKSETDDNIIVAEPQYFDIFRYDWLAGNSASLNEPFKVVLSKSEAQKYFGNIPLENVIGKQLLYDDSLELIVAGIVNDWKGNSDFHFKDFISWATIKESFLKDKINVSKWSNWDSDNQVFVKLANSVKPLQLSTQLHQFSKSYLKPSDAKPEVFLQPLADIHFNNSIGDDYSKKASLPVLYGLMAIAVFILLIAAINFINLSTAQSVERSKEIGIRKVLGSNKGKIVFQFLSETFLLTVLAVILAVAMVNPLLQFFHAFIPQGLTFSIIDLKTVLFLVIITIATSLLAGLYPSKILASYLPVLSLKRASTSNNTKAYLRKSLIVFQFTVSLIFIIGTLIVGNQIHFMLNKNLGFNKEAIVNIKTNRQEPSSKRDFLVQRIKNLSDISELSVSGKPPAASGQNSTIIEVNGINKTRIEAQFIAADENFLPLYKIKTLAGNNYRHSDTINQLLINETACKNLGFKSPEDAIGKMIFIGISDMPNSSQVFPITGVVADFNATSLHDAIKPLFIVPSSSISNMLNIKVSANENAGQIKQTLLAIEKLWKRVYPNEDFSYSFFDDTIASFYEQEQKTAQIINMAMIVAIFISCMGLFGLIAFTTQQRRKEIGIRKALGATVLNITVMLCKDFVSLVALAIIIASPIAWLLLQEWLQNYPYRITISLWTFVVAGFAAALIALITISFQSIKAATANPVKSLRTE
jgi:ABC-type antimicrobial peptide transport system permease subunit